MRHRRPDRWAFGGAARGVPVRRLAVAILAEGLPAELIDDPQQSLDVEGFRDEVACTGVEQPGVLTFGDIG